MNHIPPLDSVNGRPVDRVVDPTINTIRQMMLERLPEDRKNIAELLGIGENEAQALMEGNLHLMVIAVLSRLVEIALAKPKIVVP